MNVLGRPFDNSLAIPLNRLLNRLGVLWRDEAVRLSLIIFLALRVVTWGAAAVMVEGSTFDRPPLLWFDPITRQGNNSGEVYYQAIPPHAWFSDFSKPWRVYDTVWYVKIAMQGYRQDTSIVFPPLYPLLIRLLAPFVGSDYVLASLIISNLCCLLLFILLAKLIQRELGDIGVVWRTLLCLAVFPTAYYLIAGYTESLFMMLTLAAFLAALDKKWWWAGGFAFFASLTRMQGAVTCLPLAWIAYIQYRDHGWKLPNLIDRLPAAAGAVIGTGVYYSYISLSHLGSFEQAYNWGWKLSTRMPWESVITYLHRLFSGQSFGYENNNALAILVMALLAVYVTFKMKPAYAIYSWATIIVLLLRYHYGTGGEGGQFESIFRYVLMLFPCFIAMGMILRRWWLLIPYVGLAMQWGFFLLNEFLHWRWVA